MKKSNQAVFIAEEEKIQNGIIKFDSIEIDLKVSSPSEKSEPSDR